MASRAFSRRCETELTNDPHVTVRYQCSPHHVNDAFYPIIGQIWHAAGFVRGEPAATRLDKLEAMIALARLGREDIAPFLASLAVDPCRWSDIPRSTWPRASRRSGRSRH